MGALDEAEDLEVGERLLTDDEYFAQVAIVEDELIDDYLAGRLSAEERALFEDHFLLAKSHQKKLRFAQALRTYVEAESRAAKAPAPTSDARRAGWSFFSLSFKVVLTVAVVILAVLAGYRAFIHQSDLQRGQVLFQDLYKSGRPTRSRIALLNWAPFVDTRAGRGNQPGKDKLEEQSTRVLLGQSLKDNPGPASEHAFGAFSLATKDFDKAIKHLSLAVSGDPNNTAYRSDLGAALLEKGEYDRLDGREGEGADEFDRSLQEFERALTIDADFRPALFNRALCLEAKQQWRQAEAAWAGYLAKDPDSPWAAEARKGLESVRQK